MVPFDFQLRTRVVFGRGPSSAWASSRASSGFAGRCSSRTRASSRPGYVGAAVRLLEAAGIAAIPFHDFGENPDSAMVEAGRAFAEPLGVDSMIGLGGGSSLDCAKGINFLLTNGGTIGDYRGYGKAAHAAAADDRRARRPPAPAARRRATPSSPTRRRT